MTAYRQQATKRTILFCPRCTELLDQVDFGVDMCPRCEGFWIGNSVLELSGHRWPAGPQAWWRNAVRCPACATTGIVTVMTARTSSEVIVDQCFAHGVWLDRGELSRVMSDPAVEELAKLREHLAALEPSEEQLLARRERWEAEQEERARLTEIERKRMEAERAKRAAEAAETEQERAEAQRRAHADTLRELERLAENRRETERVAEAKRIEWQRIQAEIRIEEDRERIADAERKREHAAKSAEAERDAAAKRQRDIEVEAKRARAMELARELEQERRRAEAALQRERARALDLERERVRAEELQKERTRQAEQAAARGEAAEQMREEARRQEALERELERDRAIDAERVRAAEQEAERASVASAKIPVPAETPVSSEGMTEDGLARYRSSQLQRFLLQRLVADERTARERVEYLTSRIDSLRLELASSESKLVRARAELEAAEKLVEEQRQRS